MSGMDRLTDEQLYAWSNLLEWDDKHSAGDSFDSDELHELLLMSREILAHRRASQAAPAPSDGLREENERLRYVLDGVRGAIDTGRNEPLMVWRDQINIALDRAALSGSPAQEGGE